MDFENPGLVVDSVPIDSKIFGVALRKDIVLDVVRYQRHKMRQPKKTKRINEISGSKKKPRPQKGGGASQVRKIKAIFQFYIISRTNNRALPTGWK